MELANGESINVKNVEIGVVSEPRTAEYSGTVLSASTKKSTFTISNKMTETDKISPHYQPTILGPVFDKLLNPEATHDILNKDSKFALEYNTDQVERNLDKDLLPDTRAELEGKVEWWVRNEYGDE